MYIKRVGILNYKSCQSVTINFHKDNPTTFIGINDAGKSAVLKSIGLLLDPKALYNFSSDVRSTSDISNTQLTQDECIQFFKDFGVAPLLNQVDGTIIISEFVVEDEEINDQFLESVSAQLSWSIESVGTNSIFLLKHFENSNSTGRYFLYSGDTTTPSTLWNKKATELQTIKKDKKITNEEIENDNNKGRFKSIELIRAIYNKEGYNLAWAEAQSFIKNDLPLFPVYRYIDWNTSLTDIENLANDVMKNKVEASRSKLIKEANTLSETATNEVNIEFEALTKELTKDLKNISGIKAKVNFSVTEKISDLIINKTTSDGDIRLESQGEGVKRQILFAFLKWASRKNITNETTIKKFIWCFDEPEAHLYPTAQRELYQIIIDLAKGNYQVLLGTHSTIFVDRLNIKDIYKVKLNDKYSEVLFCDSIDDIHDTLGVRNSDILFFDKFLAIEGECEQILIPHFYKLIYNSSLEQDSVKLVHLGGIGQYENNKAILEKVLGDFKKTDAVIHYIFDADTKQIAENIHLIGTCDLEDLIPNNLWIRLLLQECGITITDADLDVIRAKLHPDHANTKFHKLLMDTVALDVSRTSYLPPKTSCAKIFQSYISTPADIPDTIKTIFTTVFG